MSQTANTTTTTTSDFDMKVESYLRVIKMCINNAIDSYEKDDLIMALAGTRNAKYFIDSLNEFAFDIAHGWEE
tara:strand:- start:70 stop:288 length:219 start_codon:yes stop_codon:yes gene_type:complete